jgi:hypothetical protein
VINTNEGAPQYEHTLDHFVEFFFKAGSIFDTKNRTSFYTNEETALSLFQKIWIIDKELSFKLLLWLRDCRGGAGNRSGFRSCLKWLGDYDSHWVIENIGSIPEVGRWDDLTVLFDTKTKYAASRIWADALLSGNILAAKWCKREYSNIRKQLNILNEAAFRKFITNLRSTSIVERKMSERQFSNIEYSKVPSLAMARYTNAFTKHDTDRFTTFKDAVKNKEVTINTSVLFPHDCIRTAKNGDTEIANLQFDNLPNYFNNTNEKIIVLADTSGSMDIPVSGSIKAIDISMGLALYCSDKIGKDSPFYRKFIGFESESEFKNWSNMTFSKAILNRSIFDGACGSTRIDLALNLILETAKFFNLNDNQMPTALVIVSDMQFTSGTSIPYYKRNEKPVTPVMECLEMWNSAGYKTPKIIYWNTAGYAGAPATVGDSNIALVSGFSPAILTSIFQGEDLSPRSVLERAVSKYNINVPK